MLMGNEEPKGNSGQTMSFYSHNQKESRDICPFKLDEIENAKGL